MMLPESATELLEAARRAGFSHDQEVLARIDAALAAHVDRAELGRLHMARAILSQARSDPIAVAESSCLAVPHLLAAGLTAEAAFASSLAAVFLDQSGDPNRAMEYAVDGMILVADSDPKAIESVRASLALAAFLVRLSALDLAVESSKRAFQGAHHLRHGSADSIAFSSGGIAIEAGHIVSDPVVREGYLEFASTAASWLASNGSSELTSGLLARGMFVDIALARGDVIDRAALEGDVDLYEGAAPTIISWHQLIRAMTARRHGDPEAALELFTNAIPGLETNGDDHCLIRALRERAEASREVGDLASAYSDACRLATLARDLQVTQVGRLADQVARRAEVERSASRLRAEAEQLTADLDYDVTTGARSRRWLEAHITELERTAASGAVLMIDIDRFKAINDTYGHQVGDAVLARFGTLVMQAVGEAGEVARFGGEEFVVIACFHDLAEAQRLGEQIRLRVAADDWMAIHTGITLTTSVGVSAGEFTEVRRLVASADKALLEAKRLGRDRTVVRLPDEFGTLF